MKSRNILGHDVCLGACMTSESSYRYFSSIAVVVGLLLGCGGRATRNAAPELAGRGGAGGDDVPPSSAGTNDRREGAAGATNMNDLACDVSTSRDGYDSGFEVCNGSSGRIHRTHATACRSQLPRANIGTPSSWDQCTADDECVDQANGFCDPGGGADGVVRTCQYGCITDEDCTAGGICLCGTYIGQCAPAECVTDEDCPAGLLCGAYWTQCHNLVGFACQNILDTCFDDQDCGTGRCERNTDGIRRCTTAKCTGI
jgi:hypothetical protein